MANLCDFEMMVKGQKPFIDNFFKALTQDGNVWMGRGAEADIEFEDEDLARITGWCKWSVRSALIDNAIRMRESPEAWADLKKGNSYITLMEASNLYKLEIEVYSEESGCCFQEHYVIRDGKLDEEEVVSYHEIWKDGYKTKEDAEEDYEIEISDEDWDNEEDYLSIGGFKEWAFSIA